MTNMDNTRIIIRKPNGERVGVVGDALTNLHEYPVHREIFSYAQRVVTDLNAMFDGNQMALVASIEKF